MNQNNKTEVLIGLPVTDDIILLQPYREVTIKKECKIFCQDLLNLLIPMVCIIGSISGIIIIIAQCIK
jgi:hypothetical protein